MKMKSRLNIILACTSLSVAFFSHTFAFSAEAETALLTQSNLILKNIETKLNDIVVDRNSNNEKSHISNQFLLKEIQNTNKYLAEVSGVLKEYMKNEMQAADVNFNHMKTLEDDIRDIKKIISNKQDKIAMK